MSEGRIHRLELYEFLELEEGDEVYVMSRFGARGQWKRATVTLASVEAPDPSVEVRVEEGGGYSLLKEGSRVVYCVSDGLVARRDRKV